MINITLFQLFWVVLVPLKSKWAHIFHEKVKRLNFNIWNVLHFILGIKYGFMRFKNYCVLFDLHFTQCPNCFRIGDVSLPLKNSSWRAEEPVGSSWCKQKALLWLHRMSYVWKVLIAPYLAMWLQSFSCWLFLQSAANQLTWCSSLVKSTSGTKARKTNNTTTNFLITYQVPTFGGDTLDSGPAKPIGCRAADDKVKPHNDVTYL